MKALVKQLFFFLAVIRFFPHIFIFYLHPRKNILLQERNYWIKIILNNEDYSFRNFLWLLRYVHEYRSTFYFRIGGKLTGLISFLAKGQHALHINMASAAVGEGLIIQHGFSTIIEAVKIGVGCQIWHNVTVGTNVSHSGNKATIGNYVKISAGAIVLGNITIGDNSTIGAGAVVVKDVPSNCVVVGNPAMIVKMDGQKVKIPL